jgi:hypothetical protein
MKALVVLDARVIAEPPERDEVRLTPQAQIWSEQEDSFVPDASPLRVRFESYRPNVTH